MEDLKNITEDPVQLSKGINLKDLLTKDAEFHIDLDFKKKNTNPLDNDDLIQIYDEEDEEEDSDSGNVLKYVEENAEKQMLSSPEYLSFSDLAAKMTDCISSGDCKILIIEEGDGPLVPMDAEVTIHYAAYWERASIPFDSSLTMNYGDPMKIRLGVGKILPGLELALSMVRGPTARFHALIAPTLAWGPMGVPPRIKPEPALFVVMLYNVTDLHAPEIFNELSSEEQTKYEVTMRTVKALHTESKDLFAKKKYKPAMRNYQQAMSVLNLSRPKCDQEEEDIKKLRINTYVNLAMCYCKLERPNYAISMLENLDYVTDVDKHCKALYYFGKAYQLLGNHEKATSYYKKALKLEPKNKDIGKTLAEMEEYYKKSAKKEKELWRNAFQSEPVVEEEIVYDVDEDFKNGVVDMCQDLAGRTEHVKIDLPTGMTTNEIMCIKSIVKGFEGLVLLEEGEGKRHKASIVKKVC